LIVVVVLLGMMAAFAAPSLARTIQRSRGAGFAREVANVFRSARNQAMSTGTVVIVQIDDANDRMMVYRTSLRASGERARICSQINVGLDLVPANLILDRRLDDLSSRNSIVNMNPAVELAQGLCFMPDGRVLDITGQALQATLAGTNCGDVIVSAQIITQSDTPDFVEPEVLTSCEDDRLLRSKRFANQTHFIRLSFNGSIDVKQ
jgi:type II secretory pathway pseudopilin PulG